MQTQRRSAILIAMVALLPALGRAQEPTVYTPGDGVSLPVVTKQVQPQYTPEAMQNRIEGSVELSSVVLANGAVGDVKVIRSLDSQHGLDTQAVQAMKMWEFKPGTKDGKPVAVRITVLMTFTMK
jgi:periplasmic protein TonB